MEKHNQKNQAKEEMAQAANGQTPSDKVRTIEIPEAEYLKLLADIAELKDKNLRLYADFDNARKRLERDKQEFAKYANEGLLSDFVEILDDLNRTVKVAEEKHEDYEAFLKGVEIVMKRIFELLKRSGVKPIEAKGKMFDPHLHEVLLQEETSDVEEGMVLEELQKGYTYNDRVLRTAKVKLAKKKEETENKSN